MVMHGDTAHSPPNNLGLLYPSTQAERERFYVYDINVQVHYSWGREEEKEEQEVDDRCSICFIRLGAEKKMFH